jgi:hypothetical protein
MVRISLKCTHPVIYSCEAQPYSGVISGSGVSLSGIQKMTQRHAPAVSAVRTHSAEQEGCVPAQDR